MGIHLSLEKLDGTPHPQWDVCRYVGDEDVPRLIGAIEHEIFVLGEAELMRPADHDAFAKQAWPEENQQRWQQLQSIFRYQPDYWLYFSR